MANQTKAPSGAFFTPKGTTMAKNQTTAAAPAPAETPEVDANAVQSAASAPDAPAAPLTAADPEAPAETVKARVLVDGAHGKCNDVVLVAASVAEGSPELDAHPEAVAYAESLNA